MNDQKAYEQKVDLGTFQEEGKVTKEKFDDAVVLYVYCQCLQEFK